MVEENDWRLLSGQEHLRGVTLVHRPYRQYEKNENWLHDHCSFCWATFSLGEDPEYLKEGYATLDDYYWICPKCFEDFKKMFVWKLVKRDDEECT